MNLGLPMDDMTVAPGVYRRARAAWARSLTVRNPLPSTIITSSGAIGQPDLGEVKDFAGVENPFGIERAFEPPHQVDLFGGA